MLCIKAFQPMEFYGKSGAFRFRGARYQVCLAQESGTSPSGLIAHCALSGAIIAVGSPAIHMERLNLRMRSSSHRMLAQVTAILLLTVAIASAQKQKNNL